MICTLIAFDFDVIQDQLCYSAAKNAQISVFEDAPTCPYGEWFFTACMHRAEEIVWTKQIYFSLI